MANLHIENINTTDCKILRHCFLTKFFSLFKYFKDHLNENVFLIRVVKLCFYSMDNFSEKIMSKLIKNQAKNKILCIMMIHKYDNSIEENFMEC